MQSELIDADKKYSQNNGGGNLSANEIFSYHELGSYVCLSAPHSTASFVRKGRKVSDLYTGAITEYVGEKYKYSYIVRNKFVPEKNLINDYILRKGLEKHFFLDIHAMKDGNGFDLAVGTGYFPAERYASKIKKIEELCKKYRISYVINDENYTGRYGLTGRMQKDSGLANALQLEWRKGYRDIFNCFEKVEHSTIPFIAELADFINKIYTDK